MTEAWLQPKRGCLRPQTGSWASSSARHKFTFAETDPGYQ